MMRRTLSFLLCLIMVLGLVTPAVQANAANNTLSVDNIMDNIVVEEGGNANIVIDGQTVTPSGEKEPVRLPSPTELVTEPVIPSDSVTEEVCRCADLTSAVEHGGVCLVKAPFMDLCKKTAQDIYALWGSYTHEEQTFMLDYLQSNFVAKYDEFVTLLSAPTGFASETLTDGTTVSVEGIPEEGSLTVGEATDAVKNIVDAYVAKKEETSTPLFGYDVSVQDWEGTDWQPETSVKMELELPGEKLHKNTQVYVVHVDDDGNATTIEATVTEDGKIAFETQGFSAFFGFTVDFDYDGLVYSIPGMSSIKLSELMDQLKMPLNAQDVVNVEYTDYTQLRIEQLEGDWLLTSLQAFTTEEKLTLTMADGTVYQIKVTDELPSTTTVAEVYLLYEDGTEAGGEGATGFESGNGEINLYLNNSGVASTNDGSAYYYEDFRVEVRGPGVMQINLQNSTYNSKTQTSTDKELLWNLKQLKITGGAKVIIRLGGDFQGDETITIKRKNLKTDGDGSQSNAYTNYAPMFDVVDGSLFIRIRDNYSTILPSKSPYVANTAAQYSSYGDENGSNYIQMYLDGTKDADGGAYGAVISVHRSTHDTSEPERTQLCVEDVIFKNAKRRAILVQANEMKRLYLKNCDFQSTVGESMYGGGAIHITQKSDGSEANYVDVHNVEIINCDFSGNKAGGEAGAIVVHGRVDTTFKIESSTFSSCQAKDGAAGAFMIDGELQCDGSITGCTFSNCTATTNGGAIYFKSTQTSGKTFSITGCTFTSCRSTVHGGAISVNGRTSTLNINNNTFTSCTAGQIEASKDKTTGVQLKDSYGYLIYNGTGSGGAICIATTHGDINIKGTASKKQTFKGCFTYNNGGAIAFENANITGTVTMDYLDIDSCQARDSGTAISLATIQVQKMILSNSIIQNCTYAKGRSEMYENSVAPKDKYGNVWTEDTPYDDTVFLTQDAGGTFRTTGATRTQLTVSSVTFQNNTSHTGGGGIYWNANRLEPTANEMACTWKPSLAITGCTFTNNTALRDGGGVYVEASLTLADCTFTGNYATRGGAIAQQIYNMSTRPIQEGEANDLKLNSGTVISGNYARQHGGGISIVCNATASITTPMAYPITFELGGASVTNNRAAENGGGVYFNQMIYTAGSADQLEVEAYRKVCTLDSGTISGNYAGFGKANLKVATAAPAGSGNGGGIYLQAEKNVTLDIMGASIYNNTAYAGNGGGVYMTGDEGLCTVKKNTAGKASVIGGASNKGNAATRVNNNENQGNGGGLAIFGGARIDLQYGTVSYNTADTAGGGIALNNSKVTADGGTVSFNKAVYGGGISLTVSGTPTTIVDESNGAAPNANADWGMVFNNGNITDNVASGLGGGICLSNKSTMKLSGGNVLRNYVGTANQSGTSYTYVDGQNGGGIAVCQGSRMNIYSGQVSSNHAFSGGGISVQGGSALQMLPTAGSTAAGTVSGNQAANTSSEKGYGGGIYVAVIADAKNTLYINQGTVQSNNAYYGGGIAVMKSGAATINGGTIASNSATYWGGAAYLYGATFTVSAGKIHSNKGPYSGGAIYATRSNTGAATTVTITGGEIYSNETNSGWGGALYLTGSSCSCTITGGKIYSNKVRWSSACGGAINVEYSAQLNITGGEIYDNYANGYGGAIHTKNSATVNIEGGTIRNNTAVIGGGGIAAQESAVVSVSGLADGSKVGKIQNNQAANGGGVYVITGASLTITNGHIINNTAIGLPAASLKVTTGLDENVDLKGAGGGIYVASGNSSSERSSFTLQGTQMAIYGNIADFIGDDVFSNGTYTLLDIPTVDGMDLEGFEYPAAGWVEDYCTGDTGYEDAKSLNMVQKYVNEGVAVPDDLIYNGASRYRNTPAMYRNYTLIEPEYVTGKKPNGTPVSGTYVNMEDAYVAMTLGIPGAVDDTVVIDYVTAVNINLWQNDMFLEIEDFALRADGSKGSNLGWNFPTNALTNNGIYYTSAKNNVKPVGTYTSSNYIIKSYGTVYNGYNGVVTYSTTKTNITGTDEFCYVVRHGDYWYYAKVTVIPATTLYFDDTHSQVKYHTDADSTETLAGWTSEGAYASNLQDEDRPGDSLMDALDKNSVYGFDSSYSDTKTFSNGSAHKVTVSHHDAVDVKENNGRGDGICDKCHRIVRHSWVDANNDNTCDTCKVTGCPHDKCVDGNNDNLCDRCGRIQEHECIDNKAPKNICDICGRTLGRHSISARASFTFTGTGFDIISLCSVKTGIVMVNVYQGTNIDFDNPDMSKYVTSYMVDTYLKYRYDENKKQWVEATPNDDPLYQIYQVPVIKADLTKIVEEVTDKNNDGVLEYKYKDCGYGTYTVELYVAPSFLEREAGYWSADFYLDAIRIYNPAGVGSFENPVANQTIQDAYLADNEGWPEYIELRNMLIEKKNLNLAEANGAIFIDGITNPTLKEYQSWGPNNEIYLNPGQSIAFKMDMTGYDDVAGIQVGMRALTGKSKVYIYYGTSVANSDILKTGSVSATDMYYDLSWKNSDGSFKVADKVVIISNKGTVNPIAITNIKVTHTSAPTRSSDIDMIKVSEDIAETAMQILGAGDLVESPVVTPERPALSFNGMVCYNVFFSTPNMGDLPCEDVGLAVFSTEDTEGTIETAREVIYGATKIDGMYMTATSGVHAKNLGDRQYFRAFAKTVDGSLVYSKMVSYSAVDYAKNVLAKSTDVKLKQLVVAMLNYGAEAQKFFGYKTDELMNASLTADDQALVTDFNANSLNAVGKVDASKIGAFASTGGFTKKSPAISFKGAFEINYFFTPAHVVEGDMKLYFWNEDTYNSVEELTAENADKTVTMTTENGSYTASSDEIAAKYLDQTVYVAAVYESGGETYCSGVLPYSIAAYCQKPPASVQDLAVAAAIYGCTAKQYFGV